MRKIKKYANRKLYDTRDKQYICLARVGALMEAGEQVQVLDNQTGEDITTQVVSQILSRKKTDEQLPASLIAQLVKKGGSTLGGYMKKTTSMVQSAVNFAEDEVEKIVQLVLKNEDLPEGESRRLRTELAGRTEKLKVWIGEKVDQRITEALRIMKVPTREDLEKLTDRIERLTRKVEAFESREGKEL